MRVLFRVDGGPAIGWGHVSRCVALAADLVQRGVHVIWACRSEPGLSGLMDQAPEISLSGQASFEPLPLSEIEPIVSACGSIDWVVVDHYGAHPDYLAALRAGTGAKILLMDDHQIRPGADLRLAPMQPPARDALTGPEYLLMRDCFDPAPSPQRMERSGLLICFGGADHPQHTRSALEALVTSEGRPSPITVIASDVLAERQRLDALVQTLGPDVERLAWIDGSEMASRFSGVACALVSSSVLAFEALAMGAPVVSVESVDNQRYHAETLRRLGVPSVQEIDEAVRLAVGGRAVSLPEGQIDAQGAGRVAAQMLGQEERG